MRCLLLLLVTLASTFAFAGSATAAQIDGAGDDEDMAVARAALKAHHGAQVNSLVLGERLELHSNSGDPLLLWEGQGWVGGDLNKLWVKTEGEYDVEPGKVEELELQALFSRAVTAFWDLQLGVRYDSRPQPSRSYAVLGLQGLAPQWIELDAALFLSDRGDLSVRLEGEYDIRITQQWLLQSRIELNGGFANDAELGVGSGLGTAQVGLRLRYALRNGIAPYLGVSWQRGFGGTRDFRRLQGEDNEQLSLVAGVRFWF